MPIEVTMPRLSDTMEQGTVVKWNVKPGDTVSPGDVLADIETDKATMELQSFDAGTVAAIPAPEGKAVPVGTVIMLLAKEGEDAKGISAGSGQAAGAGQAKAEGSSGGGSSGGGSSGGGSVGGGSATATAKPGTGTPSGASERSTSNGTASSGSASQSGGRVFASPLAKKIAEETGVDLSRLSGSGPGGRIVRKDVEAATGDARGGKPAGDRAPAKSDARPLPSVGATLEARTVALSSMRGTIAKRLVESKTTIPHYQVTVDVDMDALLALRAQLNEQLSGLGGGVKLSVNDFLVRACALAMHEHPFVNSKWVDGGKDGPAIEILGQINVGIAIALPMERGGGLVVGTIRGADQLGLRHISGESKRLANKAREKGLTIEEMSDSTFTISNLGMFGVSHFTAIINPPNVAILAVGAAVERPVVKDGKIVVGAVMSMTMSSDHRVVDGAMAAAYLQSVKGLLEKPAALLV